MDAIARRTESDIHYGRRMRRFRKEGRLSIAQATAHAACTTAADVGADAILTVSQSGLTARLVSHFHPETPIIACLLSEEVRRQMALSWGVTPLLMPRAANTDELIQLAVQAAEQAGLVRTGDLVWQSVDLPGHLLPLRAGDLGAAQLFWRHWRRLTLRYPGQGRQLSGEPCQQ